LFWRVRGSAWFGARLSTCRILSLFRPAAACVPAPLGLGLQLRPVTSQSARSGSEHPASCPRKASLSKTTPTAANAARPLTSASTIRRDTARVKSLAGRRIWLARPHLRGSTQEYRMPHVDPVTASVDARTGSLHVTISIHMISNCFHAFSTRRTPLVHVFPVTLLALQVGQRSTSTEEAAWQNRSPRAGRTRRSSARARRRSAGTTRTGNATPARSSCRLAATRPCAAPTIPKPPALGRSRSWLG
jgi:hypothetical protein